MKLITSVLCYYLVSCLTVLQFVLHTNSLGTASKLFLLLACQKEKCTNTQLSKKSLKTRGMHSSCFLVYNNFVHKRHTVFNKIYSGKSQDQAQSWIFFMISMNISMMTNVLEANILKVYHNNIWTYLPLEV